MENKFDKNLLLRLICADSSFLTLREKLIFHKFLSDSTSSFSDSQFISFINSLTVDSISFCVKRVFKRVNWNGAEALKKVILSSKILENFKIRWTCWDSLDFPAMLREMKDPPYMLFYRGCLEILNRKCVSVVGTRRATPCALKAASDFARSACDEEECVVSGLAFGIDATAFFLEGGHRRPEGDASIVIPADLPTEIAIQPSVYASDNWTVSEKLALESGIRLSAYTCAGEFMAYPELRFSGRYSLLPTLSFKAGANTMTQYIHLISNTLSISPMDTWKMSDANVPATTGWQTSAGAYWTFMGGKVDLSIEGYYKKLHDYIDYGPMASLVMNETLYRDLVRTKGESYGLEFMLRKSVGRLNGWVSYTWSRSFLKDTQYEGINAINGGKWYRSSTDKPHDFKFVGNYAFTRRYSFSLNVDYSTGRPVTLPVAYYQYAGGTRLAYSGRNAYRVPDYFRMDVAFNIDPGHYLKALAHASLTIGCYNVTGRRNAYSVFFDTRGGIGLSGHLLSIFAVPVPYVNLNILF